MNRTEEVRTNACGWPNVVVIAWPSAFTTPKTIAQH